MLSTQLILKMQSHLGYYWKRYQISQEQIDVLHLLRFWNSYRPDGNNTYPYSPSGDQSLDSKNAEMVTTGMELQYLKLLMQQNGLI